MLRFSSLVLCVATMVACNSSSKKLPTASAHTDEDVDGSADPQDPPQPGGLVDRPDIPNPSQSPDNQSVPQPTPTPPPTLPPIDETVPARDRVLAATGKNCSDADYGKNGLEVCWKSSAGNTISRFESITLNFSLQRGSLVEQLSAMQVNSSFQMLDSDGNKVAGTLLWRDNRTLLFDPYQELKPEETYTVQILSTPGSPQRPVSNLNRPLTPFTLRLTTGAAFRMSHSIDGIDLSLDRGLQLNRQTHKNMVLTSKLDDADNAKRITLRRLGSKDAWTACEETCTSKEFAVPLAGTLAPAAGVNAYEWSITSQRGEVFYRQLAFLWGDLGQEQSSTLVHAALDANNGLPALARMISDFAAGRFTMMYENEKRDFNGIMEAKKANYPNVVPADCGKGADTQFTYLGSLGPFCNMGVSGDTPILGGVLGNVHYSAITHIYVTEMKIATTPGNVNARLEPEQGDLAVHLGVKHFYGRLKIILDIKSATYGIFNIPVPGATGFFVFETAFKMEGPQREAHAKTDINAKDGRITLQIRGMPEFKLENPVNGSANSTKYFDTKDWHDNVAVDDPNQVDPDSGLWAKVVNSVVTQAVRSKVKDFKPQIVNGIGRDIIQIVAPNSLSTIAHQLGEGLTLPMPYYLPEPVASYKAKVKGQIFDGLGLQTTADNRFITAKVGVNIEGIPVDGQMPPPAMGGDRGVMKLSQSTLPTPLDLGVTAPAGSLISLNIDAMNQLISDIWKKGMFNLNVDQNVIRTIERFAVFDPNQLKNGKEILLAEFIPKLMSSDLTRVQAIGADGKPMVIGKDDVVAISIKPLLPPIIKLLAADGARNGRVMPEFELSFGDMLMNVKGTHQGKPYNLATIRLAMKSKSALSFKPYSNPKNLSVFQNVGALSLQVDRSAAALDFMVEVIEGPDANPFGFDTEKLRSAVYSMVDELFLPLINDGLRELPLTGLKTCGLELDAGQAQFMPIPQQNSGDTLVLKAPIKSYAYAGHCDLKPDMPPNPPPLPDPEPTPTPTPTPNPGGGGGGGDADGEPIAYTLNMDFSKIPWMQNGSGAVPEVDGECQKQVFYDPCASAWVVYQTVNGKVQTDEHGRPIYDYTAIRLYTLVNKDNYALAKGDKPSVEGQFFDFNRWPEYAVGFEANLVFHDSVRMRPVTTPIGIFQRHYVDYETNSPKASGFIPIRNVTLHRVLEKPFTGAEISTEFFVDMSPNVPVPEGRLPMAKAEGLDYHVGNMHVLDCGKIEWCEDPNMWLMIYDAKVRPEDKSLPEDVVPYLKAALNSIVAGMFP